MLTCLLELAADFADIPHKVLVGFTGNHIGVYQGGGDALLDGGFFQEFGEQEDIGGAAAGDGSDGIEQGFVLDPIDWAESAQLGRWRPGRRTLRPATRSAPWPPAHGRFELVAIQ